MQWLPAWCLFVLSAFNSASSFRKASHLAGSEHATTDGQSSTEATEKQPTYPECYTHLREPFDSLNGTFCALWPHGRVPEEKEGAFGPEASEFLANGVNRLTNVTVPTLFASLVPNASAAIMITPGGGYSILDWNGEGTDVAYWLNQIGISVFILKYRVPERDWLSFGEAPKMDAQRAMRLIRYRSEDLGLVRHKIGIMGFSAGGHLAATTCTNFDEDSYHAVDEVDDAGSRPDIAVIAYPWKLLAWRRYFMTMPVNRNTPPTFLVQAKDDEVAYVENSEKYWDKLQSYDVPSELHVYDSAPVAYHHGYGNCITPLPSDPDADICKWPTLAENFLHQHWGTWQ